MKFVDTHTHLFNEQFDDDRQQVILAAIEQGVEKMFLPNVSVDSLGPMLKLHRQFPNNCFPMAGLHPCDIKENYKAEIATIRKWIEVHIGQCRGIGETGLDYYWDTTFVEEQKESLRIHAKWAKEFKLPIILHTRNSFEDNFQIMKDAQDGSLKGIFHCFTGNLEKAIKVIDLGFLLGIGGVITFQNSGKELREVLRKIPLEYIVLETDSPYLAPAPNRGKRNQSSYIPLIAQKLAEIKEITIKEVAEITTSTANTIFNVK